MEANTEITHEQTENVIGKENKIVTGVILQQLLLFFFPILFGTFFQQLYNAADAVIVGRFVGKEALSAVGGGTGTLIQLLVGFFVGVPAIVEIDADQQAALLRHLHDKLALAY